MAGGLLALLDDIAALVKVNAISLDDISTYTAKASSKASGVVIDDAAVTPKYVVGLSPKRELAIIWAIAKRSFINKLCFLTPLALMLGYFLPWIITPILMIGGAYLCMEGYEKIHGYVRPHAYEVQEQETAQDAESLEKERIQGAVRTDMILSAEIIAIVYAQLAGLSVLTQLIVLGGVATLITAGVYGAVAIIVKADDVGYFFATRSNHAVLRATGRGIVRVMPPFLKALSAVGTVAMLWVGGEIIIHGIAPLHQLLHAMQHAIPYAIVAWCATVICAAIWGIFIGWGVVYTLHIWQKITSHAA